MGILSKEDRLSIIGDIYTGLVLGIKEGKIKEGYALFAPACYKLLEEVGEQLVDEPKSFGDITDDYELPVIDYLSMSPLFNTEKCDVNLNGARYTPEEVGKVAKSLAKEETRKEIETAAVMKHSGEKISNERQEVEKIAPYNILPIQSMRFIPPPPLPPPVRYIREDGSGERKGGK